MNNYLPLVGNFLNDHSLEKPGLILTELMTKKLNGVMHKKDYCLPETTPISRTLHLETKFLLTVATQSYP